MNYILCTCSCSIQYVNEVHCSEYSAKHAGIETVLLQCCKEVVGGFHAMKWKEENTSFIARNVYDKW